MRDTRKIIKFYKKSYDEDLKRGYLYIIIILKYKYIERWIGLSNKEKIKCPICGEEMEEHDYAYDNNIYGKKYYKCKVCGHKMNTMD